LNKFASEEEKIGLAKVCQYKRQVAELAATQDWIANWDDQREAGTFMGVQDPIKNETLDKMLWSKAEITSTLEAVKVSDAAHHEEENEEH